MEYTETEEHFKKFISEEKITGDKDTYWKWIVICISVGILLSMLITLFNFYAGLIIFFILIAIYYAPAVDKSLSESVSLQEIAFVDVKDKVILFLKPGAGFFFTIWPLNKTKVKVNTIDLPYDLSVEPIWTAQNPIFEDGEEEKLKGDLLAKIRLPLKISGAMQVVPENPIKFFQRIIDLKEYKEIGKKKRPEAINLFLKQELAKQIYPELRASLAEEISQLVPAQVILRLSQIRLQVEERLRKKFSLWGFRLEAAQIASPQMQKEVEEVLTQVGVAVAEKEITVIQAIGRQISIEKEQQGWINAMEKYKNRIGPEFFKVFKEPETAQKFAAEWSKGVEGGKFTQVQVSEAIAKNPLFPALAMLSPTYGRMVMGDTKGD